MKITLSEFKGIAPKFDPIQLNDGYAVTSVNTRSGRDILESWQMPKAAAGGGLHNDKVKSLFKYNTKWFSWDKENVSAVRVPLANDPWDYVVIADPDTYPQMTFNTIAESGVAPFPNVTHRLGVYTPDAPTIEGSGTHDAPSDGTEESEFDAYETNYIVVFVDAFGRASAPSSASDSVVFKEYEGERVWYVDLKMPDVPLHGIASDAGRGTVAKWYVYRGNFNGAGSGLYQFAGTVDNNVDNPVFKDTVPSMLLDESPTTYDWTPPPDDDVATFPNGALRKVVSIGDFLAGHNDRLVCFSEPAAFHAWPTAYYQVFSEQVVTIMVSGANLVVLTDSHPYVLSGAAPSAMSPTKLAEPVACVSQAGVTEVFDRVYFVSTNGLFEIEGYLTRNVSRDYMTEKQWAALDPSTMTLSHYEGFVFIHSPSAQKTYVFDPANPTDGLREVDLNPQATCQLTDSADLAFVEQGGTEVMLFDADLDRSYPIEWHSKEYTFNTPICFSVAKVRANAYPVNVTVKCEKLDGTEDSYTKTVQSADFFYLPFQNRSKRWWVEVHASASVEIQDIQVGQTAQEFI
ncbi:hypothetical protein [Shewanella gaetbuli]|uniref:Uncharacterized protein n=1 Tax=Shewanella gaetbuli TaxID=220752 RepID=A0A9X1ZNU1_9GAMM|nr:hypothetical protein [Shewanella gaetbuli]MCL1142987.1 hypothetical protein [Shewanella gaetbuli]